MSTCPQECPPCPPVPRSVHRAVWRWRDGSRPVSTEYYVTPDYGVDTNSSLSLAGLVVFTDARVESSPGTGQAGYVVPVCDIELDLWLRFRCFELSARSVSLDAILCRLESNHL